MGQLDRTALLAPHAQQRLGLNTAAWHQVITMAHPYALMPYELAEIEESSLALDEAIRDGEAPIAVMLPWGFVR